MHSLEWFAKSSLLSSLPVTTSANTLHSDFTQHPKSGRRPPHLFTIVTLAKPATISCFLYLQRPMKGIS